MLSIFKNNWHRILEQKLHLIIALALTVVSVALGIGLTGKMAPGLHLAVKDAPAALTESKQSGRRLDLTRVSKDPGLTPLIEGRFDAFIDFKSNGTYTIRTLKPKSFRQTLNTLLAKAPATIATTKATTTGAAGTGMAATAAPATGRTNVWDDSRQNTPQTEPSAGDATRKTGANIISFTLMFLLMQGMLYAQLFAEDKEHRQLRRIVCAPLPFRAYMLGQALFVWLLVALPAFQSVAVARLLGVSIGFSLGQYALLFGLSSLLATGAALCINAFFRVADTANMAGTCILILTSILAGSFYKWNLHNKVLRHLINLLPQKQFLSFGDAWERHLLTLSDCRSLIYVIIFSAVLLAIAVIKTRKDYVANRHA